MPLSSSFVTRSRCLRIVAWPIAVFNLSNTLRTAAFLTTPIRAVTRRYDPYRFLRPIRGGGSSHFPASASHPLVLRRAAMSTSASNAATTDGSTSPDSITSPNPPSPPVAPREEDRVV
jgi:hypothetical protein